MSVYLQPVTGPVAYQKVVYTIERRRFDVHYVGDVHTRDTKCTAKDALTYISLLVNSLHTPSSDPIDVFVEIGLNASTQQGGDSANYLDELTFTLQQLGCLNVGVRQREICAQHFPNARFHNVDFRLSLYARYIGLLQPLTKTASTIDNVLRILYVECEQKTAEDAPANRQTLVTCEWVYDVLVARYRRYAGTPPTPYAQEPEEFVIDFYIMLLMSPFGNGTNHNPISTLFRKPGEYQPYWLERLFHAMDNVPELRGGQARTTAKGVIENHFAQMAARPEQQAPINVVERTSYLFDMYTCLRALKPSVSHLVVIAGAFHIKQMKDFMRALGVHADESRTFNMDLSDDKGKIMNYAQCVGVPMRTVDGRPSMTFDDDPLANVQPEAPAHAPVKHTGTRRRSRAKRKTKSKRSRTTQRSSRRKARLSKK